MGNKDVRTPHIDRLAGQSLVFENTFANTPVCCPARAILLTGKYAHKNGMVANDLRLRESETTIAEMLREAGYRTGFIGKWHLDGGPRQPGFVPPGPRRQGFEFWAAHECSHAHFDNHYFRDTNQPIKLGKFEAEGWTDLAVEFLEKSRTDSRPFFLTVQMGPPHDPYKAPPEYSKLYDPAKLSMRKNWTAGDRVPGPQQIAEYYGMVTAVDDQVGRMMGVLARLGLEEDTVVVLSSDHGDMLGSHGLRLKRKPWEESIRVPGVIRYPRVIKTGRRTKAILTHVDFAPTVAGLCGLRARGQMQGTNFAPYLRGARMATPDSALFQIFGPFAGDGTADGWRGVRTERYMYARYETKPWVLYDLDEDPYQLRNLAAEPGAAPVLKAMESRLADWMKRTGDSWKYNWHQPVEDGGRLYKDRTFYSVEDYLNSASR
jgi:arylsulfatase A-like enzyme